MMSKALYHFYSHMSCHQAHWNAGPKTGQLRSGSLATLPVFSGLWLQE